MKSVPTVRSQARVVALSFLVATVASATLALNRSFFEARIKETYRPASPELQALVTKLSRSEQAVTDAAKLEPEQRESLYDQWMQLENPAPQVAARLVRADPALYVSRAERTLVVGSAHQRDRAIAFLVQSESALSEAALRRARGWFERKRDLGSRDAVDRAVVQLETASTRRRP